TMRHAASLGIVHAAQAREGRRRRHVPSVMATLRHRRASPARGSALALGLQHRPGAVPVAALAGPQLLGLGGMRLVQVDAVVVGQLLAGLDVAQRVDEDLVLVLAALRVLLDLGLAVGLAAVVHPARDVALDVGVDDVFVIEREQEGVPVLVLVAVVLVHLGVGAQRALVADHPLALPDQLGGEYAVAVDRRQAGFDLLLLLGHRGHGWRRERHCGIARRPTARAAAAEASPAPDLSRAGVKSTILVPIARCRADAPRHQAHRLRHRGADRARRAARCGAQRERTGRTRRPRSADREQAAQAAGAGRAGGRLPWRARRLPPGAAGRRDQPGGDRRGDGRPAGDDRMQPGPRRMRHLRAMRGPRQLAPHQRRGRGGAAQREPGADARRRRASPTRYRPAHPGAPGQRMNTTGSPTATQLAEPVIANKEIHEQLGRRYDAGFVTDIESDSLPPGLDEDVVRALSAKKGEPEWMTQWRLAAYRHWLTMPVPHWAKLRIAPIDFQAISYYS